MATTDAGSIADLEAIQDAGGTVISGVITPPKDVRQVLSTLYAQVTRTPADLAQLGQEQVIAPIDLLALKNPSLATIFQNAWALVLEGNQEAAQQILATAPSLSP